MIEQLIYDDERRYVHGELDFDYIDACAEDIVAALIDEGMGEVNYQPGDWTRYPLVFVHLARLIPARARVVDGVPWPVRSVDGMFEVSGQVARFDNVDAPAYDNRAYLVTWVEHASYPLWLHPERGYLALDYVSTKFKTTPTSAMSLVLLFRRVAQLLPGKVAA